MWFPAISHGAGVQAVRPSGYGQEFTNCNFSEYYDAVGFVSNTINLVRTHSYMKMNVFPKVFVGWQRFTRALDPETEDCSAP
jgi:hypothetical protein